MLHAFIFICPKTPIGKKTRKGYCKNMSNHSSTSWNRDHKWYVELTRNRGHDYHTHVILPRLLPHLPTSAEGSILEMGCGSGVLARVISPSVSYTGVDNAPQLLQAARKNDMSKKHVYISANATKIATLPPKKFTDAVFLLSLQNMDDGASALQQASRALQQSGTLHLVLNHPCFRIPQYADWSYDEKRKKIGRILFTYLTPLRITIIHHPGKKKSAHSYSFHNSLSTYMDWLRTAGLGIIHIEEWTSHKKSVGTRAKEENEARKEIPVFLYLKAKFLL